MKKIILIILLVFISPVFWNNYYSPDFVDKCCLVNLTDYKLTFSEIECKLKTDYPEDKKYLDSIIAKIVEIVNKKYASRKEEIYQALAFKISDYIYNHNIQKWTKAYYKLAYLAFTFYDYYLFYKKQKEQTKLDSFLEKIAND